MNTDYRDLREAFNNPSPFTPVSSPAPTGGHWSIWTANSVLHFRCSDGRTGSEPWSVSGFHRIHNLIGSDTWECIAAPSC